MVHAAWVILPLEVPEWKDPLQVMHTIKAFVHLIKLTDLMEMISSFVYPRLMCFDSIGEKERMDLQVGLGGVDLFGLNSLVRKKENMLVHQQR